MDNGFSTSDAVLTAAMSGGGFGRGGGMWGGGYYGQPFADLTSLQHGQANISQRVEDHGDHTRDIMSLNVKNISDNFESVNRAAQFTAIKDGQFQAELRTNDRLLALQSEINENARRAAECCCETQKEILKLDASNNLKFAQLSAGQATILERLNANKEISELRAQLQTKDIFATCGCGCGGGIRPCPPVA